MSSTSNDLWKLIDEEDSTFFKIVEEGCQSDFPVKSDISRIPIEIGSGSGDDAGLATRHFDVVISRFADKFLIVVTEIGKPGTIFRITRDEGPADTGLTTPSSTSGGGGGGGSSSRYIYSVDLLLGHETLELLTAARCIAQSLSTPHPIILTLGFSAGVPPSPAAISKIAEHIKSRAAALQSPQ